jgi:hypothetical protein
LLRQNSAGSAIDPVLEVSKNHECVPSLAAPPFDVVVALRFRGTPQIACQCVEQADE